MYSGINANVSFLSENLRRKEIIAFIFVLKHIPSLLLKESMNH